MEMTQTPHLRVEPVMDRAWATCADDCPWETMPDILAIVEKQALGHARMTGHTRVYVSRLTVDIVSQTDAVPNPPHACGAQKGPDPQRRATENSTLVQAAARLVANPTDEGARAEWAILCPRVAADTCSWAYANERWEQGHNPTGDSWIGEHIRRSAQLLLNETAEENGV
jgi:hypothetical protein